MGNQCCGPELNEQEISPSKKPIMASYAGNEEYEEAAVKIQAHAKGVKTRNQMKHEYGFVPSAGRDKLEASEEMNLNETVKAKREQLGPFYFNQQQSPNPDREWRELVAQQDGSKFEG